MKKVSFDQNGVDEKRKELYSLPEEDFRKQLKEIQNNTKSWTLDNFLLSDAQIEYLKTIPDELIVQIGLSAAIAFDYDLKLVLTTPSDDNTASRIKICNNTSLSGHVYGHWSEGENPTIDSWEVTLGFTL